VHGVDEREEIADGDGLHAVPSERRHRGTDLLLVERRQHGSARVQPLANPDTTASGSHERGGLRIHVEVVHARALLPAELQHVLKALGGEHGRHGALLLQHRVGGHGRAVDEALDVSGGRIREREDTIHGGPDAVEQVLGRGGDLRQRESALTVEGNNVGERAADVDADLHACGLPVRGPIVSPLGRRDERVHRITRARG
jgi:hypothetical protein